LEYNKPIYGENWGVNHAWVYGIPFDVWFVIDGWQAMIQATKTEQLDEDKFLEYAKNFKGKIYSFRSEQMYDKNIDKDRPIASSESLPHHLLRGLVGTFFTSSIAWMLAMVALQEDLGNKKVDLVNLYGIELWISHNNNEYTSQANCVNYWIAYLNGKGIQVNIPAFLLFANKYEDNLYGFKT